MSYQNNVISSGDPQAIEKLTAKLEKCKADQIYMKDVNAYYRSNGTCKGYPDMPDTTAEKLDSYVGSRSWVTQPFDSYALTNNNAEIRRLEKRIAEVTRNQDVGFSGWEFEGGQAEANTDMNRLQLFFDERPSAEQCSMLKRNGFKWAPSQGAWQRQLTDNAIYSAGRIDFIKPSDGRTVREHQPKAQKRDDGAR